MLEVPVWSERSEIKADYMSLMPFCSIMGYFSGKGLQYVPSSAPRSKQDQISPEMRPGCSGLYPVTAQRIWTTCSRSKISPVQLSCSKPAFSSGWGNKNTIFMYSNESASITPGKTRGEQHNTTQPHSSSELNQWLQHWYNIGANLLTWYRMPGL